MTKIFDKILILLFIVIVGLGLYLLLYDDSITLKNIILDKKEISIYINEKSKINVRFDPEDATDKSIIIKSSKPAIASVNNKGEISAISKGETDIIVSTLDERIVRKCHVKVKEKVIEKIKLEETSAVLRVGERKVLKVTTLPENATNKKLIYSSNDTSVATIDENGNIIAKKSGKAVITIKSASSTVKVTFNVTVYNPGTVLVNKLIMSKSSVRLNIGKTEKLSVKISPSNAANKKILWSSSDKKIATVDSNGLVKGIRDGVVTITATSDDSGKKATCSVTVKANNIVPVGNISYKYEGTTLKYYVQNNTNYYLTYIWMEDPYNQIKKLESTTAQYGKLMSDDELIKQGKKSLRKTVGDMLNAYIKKGMISKNKALVAFNASGFFDSSVAAWKPVSDYYNLKTNSWFVLTDGKIIRNRITDSTTPQSNIIGIAPSGKLMIYDGSAKEESDRKKKSDTILKDKIKNTWSFSPVLIKNGIKKQIKTDSFAQRQAICQINTNNYVMLTTINSKTKLEVRNILYNIGCKEAFNLDGGGSTSMFYKKNNTSSITKIKCADGSNQSTCRSVVDGIYFIEK